MTATRLLVGSGELLQPLWRRPPFGKARVVLQEEHGRVVDGLVVHFLLLADVLGATAVLVLKGRQDQLVAFEAALLHSGERWCGGIPPLRDEHNEGQGFW